MTRATIPVFRLLALIGVALIGFVVDSTDAWAQSSSCARLQRQLASLDRNSEFQSVEGNSREARALQREVQRNESAYVRNGCNADAKAGRQLSRECRALAREIRDGRQRVEAMNRTVETGNAVSQQREALLQEIARFGCNSRVRQLDDGNDGFGVANRDRGNLFDQLFGAISDSFDSGDVVEDEWGGYGSYHTVRTLCVRKADGFYWPISYSTLTDYVANDADTCREMCPGLDVDLYYYDNPGQEPEQMVNLFGEPYTALPNAFKFRTEIDKSASCKPPVDYGSITLADLGDGRTRPMITFRQQTFPLPPRDPRQQVAVQQAALEEQNFVNVPLPRRRPAAPGEEPKAVPVAPVVSASTQPIRIVEFGNKRVRIVGPDTPYAPTAATGT